VATNPLCGCYGCGSGGSGGGGRGGGISRRCCRAGSYLHCRRRPCGSLAGDVGSVCVCVGGRRHGGADVTTVPIRWAAATAVAWTVARRGGRRGWQRLATQAGADAAKAHPLVALDLGAHLFL